MDVFSTTDYREFIEAKIRSSTLRRGYRTALAKAAGCQNSQLTRVLQGEAHLTPDQAAGLCAFWELDALESQYFLTIVNLARAHGKALKTLLRRSLDELVKARRDLAKAFAKPEITALRDQAVYYASWQWSAVHILAWVESFRTPTAIAARLKQPQTLVERIVDGLCDMGLLKRHGRGVVPTAKQLHLGADSPMIRAHHLNWRLKALEDPGDDDAAVHYTAVHALSEADVARLTALVRDCIKRTRAVVEASGEETLVCFTCDLFRV